MISSPNLLAENNSELVVHLRLETLLGQPRIPAVLEKGVRRLNLQADVGMVVVVVVGGGVIYIVLLLPTPPCSHGAVKPVATKALKS